MRNLAELNINEGGARPTRPAPSADEFREFEAAFGIVMPHELKKLLQYANGGHPERDAVGGADAQYAVNTIYHLRSEGKDHPENMWNIMMSGWRSILGPQAIPFANDGGGNQFFIDLADPVGSVKICLHNRGMTSVKLADSFSAFIDLLDNDPEMI